MTYRKLLLNILYFLLFLTPYQAFIGLEIFPTWRIISLLFISIGFLYFKFNTKDSYLWLHITLAIVYIVFLLIQLSYNLLFFKIEGYDILYFILAIVQPVFVYYIYQLVKLDYLKFIKVINLSIYFFVSYQLFQLYAYYNGHIEWVTILNGNWVNTRGTFTRLVNNVFAPPGFMMEAPHCTLFFIPYLIVLLILTKIKLYAIDIKLVLVILISTIITLSGGTALQLCFLAFSLIILFPKQIFKIQYFLVFLILSVGSFFSLSNLNYFIIIEKKLNEFLNSEGQRYGSINALMEIFDKNIFIGLAPKATRYYPGVDPNILIPNLLAENGIIGFIIIILMLFTPLIFALINSKNKFFVFPIIFIFIHLALHMEITIGVLFGFFIL